MHEFEDPLDCQQCAAVEATEPAIAVLAGPGSGKTRTLSYRARHLLLEDPESRALLLTFTNKAAAEMKHRAVGVAALESHRIQASTFHTFGMRTLRRHGVAVGIEADFELIDDEEQKEFAIGALGSGAGLEAWSRARLRRLTPSARTAEIGDAYEAAKRDANVVDFDDLVVYTALLFEEIVDVARAYGARFPHLLVDEFQDTNPAQFAIVRALAVHGRTVSVFADDDQAIFGWAGAETANIRRFIAELDAREFPLTVNYRSCEEIVSHANALIAAEPSASGRQMTADKSGGKVEVRVYDDMFEEAAAIASDIERVIADGVRPNEICVLARSARRAAVILPELLERDLPAQQWMGAGFDSAERRALAICLAVVRGRLNDRQASRVCDLLDVPLAEERNTRALLELHIEEPLAQALLEVNTLVSQEAPPVEVVKQVRVAVTIARPALSPQADFLVETVEAFEQHDPQFTLEHLLADLMLGGGGGAPSEAGGVKVATVHRTKGLQWPHVYLVGLEEGWLPDWHAKEANEISEERKLCFVGVCRAEDRLVLTRMEWYKSFRQTPSRFLGEMSL